MKYRYCSLLYGGGRLCWRFDLIQFTINHFALGISIANLYVSPSPDSIQYLGAMSLKYYFNTSSCPAYTQVVSISPHIQHDDTEIRHKERRRHKRHAEGKTARKARTGADSVSWFWHCNKRTAWLKLASNVILHAIPSNPSTASNQRTANNHLQGSKTVIAVELLKYLKRWRKIARYNECLNIACTIVHTTYNGCFLSSDLAHSV